MQKPARSKGIFGGQENNALTSCGLLQEMRTKVRVPCIYMALFWRRNKEDKFSSSILGLDKSIEELKAQEEAVEKEIGQRFSKAISKTRDSINDRLDTIFEGRKQIDEQLL